MLALADQPNGDALSVAFNEKKAVKNRMKILIVDDDAIQRALLGALLKRLGHDVVAFEGGDAAWGALIGGSFNVVFTDWMMPGMSGLELTRRVRSSSSGRYVYVILCSARDSRAELLEGLQSGADDYIRKPVRMDELMVRLASCERIIQLEGRLAEQNRELSEKNRSLSSAYDTIHADLVAASRVQMSLLPAAAELQGIHFDSLFLPASIVAGDVFDYFPLAATSVGFYVADVSGHGIPAAMLSVTLSKMMAARPRTISPLVTADRHSHEYSVNPPHEVIAGVNRRFQNQGDMYFTMVYGVVDTATGKLRMAQAGHPSPILLRKGGCPEALGDGGFPVGVLPEICLDPIECVIAPGDRLFIYSDGIVECVDPSGQEFGQKRLMEFLYEHREAAVGKLLRSLKLVMHQWCGSEAFVDDVSLLALEVGGP